MAEPPDLQELAKRYLDLWQDQLRAMAADPETMASVGRMLAAGTGQSAAAASKEGEASSGAPPNPFAWWTSAGAMQTLFPQTLFPMGGATPFDSVLAAGRTGAEARSEATAASSDGGGDELHELERRLAALEGRLDALESGAGTGRRSAQTKSRKRKR